MESLRNKRASQRHRPVVIPIRRARSDEARLRPRGNRIHADDARDLLDEIHLAGEIGTIARRPPAVGCFLATEAGENLVHTLLQDIRAEQRRNAREPQRDCRARCIPLREDFRLACLARWRDDRCARDFRDVFCRAQRCGPDAAGPHAALEAIARIARQPESPRRAPNARGLEDRDFQQHIGRRHGHAAFRAAHHTRDGEHLLVVRNHEVAGCEHVSLSIEREKFLTVLRISHTQCAAHFRHVECVQRLPACHHHEIGRVHDVVDRAQADAFQLRPQPPGALADFHSRNAPRGVAARRRCLDRDSRRIAAHLRFGRPGGLRDRLACERRDFHGDARVTQQVRAVRRDFEIEHGV